MMRISDLVAVLDAIAPARFAESWDNVGLLIGDPAAPLHHVLLTIDLGPAELEEATRLGCNAVVAYHPPIFKGIRRLLPGMVAFEAVRLGIAVYSPHTALDVARGGTNDTLASEVLGLVDIEALRRSEQGPGMGRKGVFDPPVERARVLVRIKKKLGVENLLVAGPRTGLARTGAVCAGSCGDVLEDAKRAGVDVYLTGEMRHHDALSAARNGLTVVCALHSNSERHLLRSLAERIRESLSGVEVHVSEVDADPFTIL